MQLADGKTGLSGIARLSDAGLFCGMPAQKIGSHIYCRDIARSDPAALPAIWILTGPKLMEYISV